jgi:hypothetical protein
MKRLNSAQFSPDWRVVTASEDKQRGFGCGQPQINWRTLEAQRCGKLYAIQSRCGRVLTASDDKTARLWMPAQPNQLVSQ